MEKERIEKLLVKVGSEKVPADVQRIAESQFDKFSDEIKGQRHIGFKEYFMKTKIIKISVAAAIIIIVLAGIPFFKSSGPSVTLAGVYGKLELINAFSYSMVFTTKGNLIPNMPASQTDIKGDILLSEAGMKMDLQTKISGVGTEDQTIEQQMYMNFETGKMYMVLPEQKKYMVMAFTEELLEQTKQESQDPREVVKQMLKCEYTSLGRDEINGVEVEGFETKDKSYGGGMFEDLTLTLWVDVEKWLPVRMDMYMQQSEELEIEGYMDNFQWDLQVDAGEFLPVIPEDYVSLTGETVPTMKINEEGAIEGLAFFAKVLNRYPKSLNLMELWQEFSKIKNEDEITEEGKLLLEQLKPADVNDEQEVMQKAMEILYPVQSLGTFYMMLLQGKEPAYYGDVVTPADTDMVLLRWKTGEDEYRVIYGDLSAGTVDGAVLAELESKIER